MSKVNKSAFRSREDLELAAKMEVLSMAMGQRPTMRVSEFFARIHFCGNISMNAAEEVYKYICYFEPYGCYLSGPAGERCDKEDYFVIPNIDIEKEMKILEPRLEERRKIADEEFFKSIGL